MSRFFLEPNLCKVDMGKREGAENFRADEKKKNEYNFLIKETVHEKNLIEKQKNLLKGILKIVRDFIYTKNG